MDYPKVAIKTTDELNEHAYQMIYRASRKFHSMRALYFNGVTGSQVNRWLSTEQEPYRFFEFSCDRKDDSFEIKSSLLDMNVDYLNGYNDWFLFHSKEDAEAYIKGSN